MMIMEKIPTPAELVRDRQLKEAYASQAERISYRLEHHIFPVSTPETRALAERQRRTEARKHGYRGVLTRAELARKAAASHE